MPIGIVADSSESQPEEFELQHLLLRMLRPRNICALFVFATSFGTLMTALQDVAPIEKSWKNTGPLTIHVLCGSMTDEGKLYSAWSGHFLRPY